MRLVSVCVLGVLLSSGCVSPRPTGGDLVATKSEYDREALSLVHKKGVHSIKGQAFLTTRGGDPKTCAGNEVVLVAATPYSEERMRLIYGNDRSGYLPTNARGVQLVNDQADYLTFRRTEMCDAAGEFAFNGVVAGDYFVVTRVIWQTAMPSTEGGTLMRRITVSTENDGGRVIITGR